MFTQTLLLPQAVEIGTCNHTCLMSRTGQLGPCNIHLSRREEVLYHCLKKPEFEISQFIFQFDLKLLPTDFTELLRLFKCTFCTVQFALKFMKNLLVNTFSQYSECFDKQHSLEKSCSSAAKKSQAQSLGSAGRARKAHHWLMVAVVGTPGIGQKWAGNAFLLGCSLMNSYLELSPLELRGLSAYFWVDMYQIGLLQKEGILRQHSW